MKKMMSTHEKWIRIFDIPEISEHKHGFTIYKIVSMLYKESSPDAITKVTVWKRFNDFKKLHREIRILHKKLNLKSKYPTLPSKTLFKRFDAEIIGNRKESILNFLDFIGNNQQLFTSNEFIKFLEISHTPKEQLNSNINLIRADLNLPEDPDLCINIINSSDDERTLSDTDSIGSSIAFSLQNDSFSDSHSKLRKLNSTTSINSQSSSKLLDSLSITTTVESTPVSDGQIYFATQNSLVYDLADDQTIQYIIDASVHINMAEELESSKKYEEAFTAYKAAVDILEKYSKDDPDYDRRQMVRYKTEKYLIRAEKIYNMFLSPEVKNLHLGTEADGIQPAITGPLFDLYKFKVVKIIASGMLALHSEQQQLFFIKVIHKNTQFLNENLILPETVPYMVKLHSHYNCEHALFLVLEYCSGIKLTDFLKTHSSNNDDNASMNHDKRIFEEIQEISDNESEQSFSDLINDYNSTRCKNEESTSNNKNDQVNTSDDDSFEKIDISEIPFSNKKCSIAVDGPMRPFVAKNLFTKSLSDISQCTFDQDIIKQKYTKKKIKEIDKVPERSESIKTERSLSQVSSLELEELNGSFVFPQEIIVKWAVQLLLALEKLHTLGVICRDLQTKNILIDDKDELVLTYMCNVKDFGDIFCDGVNYNLAPEIYSFQEVTTSADWWSYGAILYELLVGVPLSEVHPNGITNFTFLKIPKYVSPEGRSILKQLLQYEPNDRLGYGANGIESIKSHPFFYSISWESFATFQ